MLYLGSDHAGFQLKEKIKGFLAKKKILFTDLGCFTDEKRSDYPVFAKKVARAAAMGKARGILVCGSAVGMAIAANKIRGARAAQVYDAFTAASSVEEDNANIICLRGRKSSHSRQLQLLNIWLNARFRKKARYVRRLKMLDK